MNMTLKSSNQKNINKSYNGEIDLSNLLKIIWEGKIKVILIVSITFIVAFIYTSKQENIYKFSTIIKPAQYNVFVKYTSLNSILESAGLYQNAETKNGYLIDNHGIFKLIVNEFEDREEVVSILRKNDYVKKIIENMSDENQKRTLFRLAKSFYIYKPKKDLDIDYILNFTWHDAREGEKILDKAILLVLDSVKNIVVRDIKNLAKSIEIKNFQKSESLKLKLELLAQNQLVKDEAQIQYLTEQSFIAKELGIENNSMDYYIGDDFKNKDNSSIAFLFGSINNKVPYYLRGYKAIDTEINLIVNRTKKEKLLLIDEYFLIRNSLIEIESDLISNKLYESINTLENDDLITWVDYKLFLGKSRLLNNYKMYMILSIVLGMIAGLTYIYIENFFNKKKV
jgi:LPS O-antigen subunit length determinant protein (WzzB/FepE family)